MRPVPHTGRGDGGTEKLWGILPERVFVVGNQKWTVKQHERSRSFSKTGQRGLGKINAFLTPDFYDYIIQKK